MSDKNNRTFKIGDGVLYAGPHMVIIKDGKASSTADLVTTTFDEAMLENTGLCTGYSRPANAFIGGHETVTADSAVVFGRRMIGDLAGSVVFGGMGVASCTANRRFRELGLLRYWQMLADPGLPIAPLRTRLRMTLGFAWRKVKRLVG